MEKWRSKGKSGSKEESVLPPTRRPAMQNCLPLDKKKDKKWSFGGLLRRISMGQHNEASSNEEELTYIPGHMLPRKQTRRTSKMKSKVGKVPPGNSRDDDKSITVDSNFYPAGNYGNADPAESLGAKQDRSQESMCGTCNDCANSPSSEGSLDAVGRNSKINRTKARAQAKRDRLCGNSSSEDDSHRSSQSSVRFRSEDSLRYVQRTDSCRRTRGARTERYIKRMSRDDCPSDSDTKLRKCLNPPSSQMTFDNLSNPQETKTWKSTDSTRIAPPVSSFTGFVNSREYQENERQVEFPNERLFDSRLSDRLPRDVLIDFNDAETMDCDKFTWPKNNSSRSNPGCEIYGSLRPRQMESEKNGKILPPEPPPRSSKSRIIACNASISFKAPSMDTKPYYQSRNTRNIRCYNSDNDIIRSNDWSEFPGGKIPTECRDKNRFASPNRKYEETSPMIPSRPKYTKEKRDDKVHQCLTISPAIIHPRSTSSLPKGVELFSRQKLANFSDNENDRKMPELSHEPNENPMVKRRVRVENCHNPLRRVCDENEAERKRSSKNLQEALSELEAIYNSLRLSDPDLLDRAEEREMDEYRDNAAKSAFDNSLKSCSDTSSNENHDYLRSSVYRAEANSRISDDMAYRRMNPKERPTSVNGQSSLPQISYLATSPNLSIRENDSNDYNRSRRSTPDLTRDDLLFRSISHAMNTLRVIEPQPPFGIPLGPVTGSTESDYLHVKPTTTKYEKTRSLYIPKSEPDVISDDLAFRNLRKDKDNCTGINKNTNVYLQMDSLNDSSFNTIYESSSLGTRKKRAFRSNSADTKSQDSERYNDYVKTSRELRSNDNEHGNLIDFHSTGNTLESSNESRNDFCPRQKTDLDINGNRPKSGSQQKIQLHVPRVISSCDNENAFSDREAPNIHRDSRFSRSSIITESEDSSPERRSESRDSSASDIRAETDGKNIEQFTEQEISEYKQLCQDLETLIRQTANVETTTERVEAQDTIAPQDNNSQAEFDDWEKLFNDDYEVSNSISNFQDRSEIRSNEREEDCGSYRSADHSSENLTSLSRKMEGPFCDDDLLSSASEAGICSNNESFTDSVYDKFDLLLREVNDLPSVECKNKIVEYPTKELTDITSDLGNLRSLREHKPSRIDFEKNDEDSRPTEMDNSVVSKNVSHALEKGTNVLSPKERSQNQRSTNHPETLEIFDGNKTRRKMQENVERFEHRETTRKIDAARNLETLDSKEHPLTLSGSEKNARFGSQRIIEKHDFFTTTSEFDNSSNDESLSDSVCAKFDQLLKEVDYVPLVERKKKIGENSTDNIATSSRISRIGSRRNDGKLRKTEIIPGGSNVDDKVKRLENQNLSENLKQLKSLTRRVRNEDTNEENRGIGKKGKTRPKLDIKKKNDDEKFAYREGEKNVEDRLACNDDYAYASKETSVHKFRNFCHVTNSITICDIVLCSFFLTLLITIVFAQ